MEGQEVGLDVLIQEFNSIFTVEAPPKHTLKGGHLALKEYVERYRDERFKTIAVEHKFEVRINGYVFKGRQDRVVFDPLDGKHKVVDIKTTGKMGDSFHEQANPNQQFTGYIYVGNCEWGEIDTLVVDGVLVPYDYKEYKGQTKVMTADFERIETSRDEFELEEWKRGVEVTLDSLRRYQEIDYYPKWDNGYKCSQCGFRELCLMPVDYRKVEPIGDLYEERQIRS